MPPAYDLADPKEIVRRNHQITRLRQDHALKKTAAKAQTASAESDLDKHPTRPDAGRPPKSQNSAARRRSAVAS